MKHGERFPSSMRSKDEELPQKEADITKKREKKKEGDEE